MTEQQFNQLLQIVEEMRDDARKAISMQEESLTIQKEHFAMAKSQFDAAERLQAKAEQLQGRSSQLITASHRFLKTLIPVAIALLAYVTWLIFFRR